MTSTPILLHPSQPRCKTEGSGCRMRTRCARALAPAGKHELVDFAAQPDGNSALCPGYFDLAHAREDAGRRHADAIKARLTRSKV